jgi:hypothetical protein
MTMRNPFNTIKKKIDLRPDDARALLALLDAHRFDAPAADRDRLDRIRADVVSGIRWMDRKLAERDAVLEEATRA